MYHEVQNIVAIDLDPVPVVLHMVSQFQAAAEGLNLLLTCSLMRAITRLWFRDFTLYATIPVMRWTVACIRWCSIFLSSLMKWPDALIARETPGSVEVSTTSQPCVILKWTRATYAKEVRYPAKLPQTWKLPCTHCQYVSLDHGN